MATEVKIPQLGVTMQEGEIAEWFVEEGAQVKAGDPIYLLESDKSSTDVESPSDGILRIRVPEGASYPVGTVVAEIE